MGVDPLLASVTRRMGYARLSAVDHVPSSRTHACTCVRYRYPRGYHHGVAHPWCGCWGAYPHAHTGPYCVPPTPGCDGPRSVGPPTGQLSPTHTWVATPEGGVFHWPQKGRAQGLPGHHAPPSTHKPRLWVAMCQGPSGCGYLAEGGPNAALRGLYTKAALLVKALATIWHEKSPSPMTTGRDAEGASVVSGQEDQEREAGDERPAGDQDANPASEHHDDS